MADTTDPQGEITTISTEDLTQQESTESRGGGVRSSWQNFAAPGMTPLRLSNYLRAAANWDPARLMEFAQEVEERDPHFRSVLGTRKMAVSGLEWEVTPASEDERDAEIASFVSDAIAGSPFVTLVVDLLDAVSKGYAASEIVWKVDGGRLLPAQYMYIDPRYLNFDSETQTELQLLTDEERQYGEPLTPGKYVQHVPKLKSGKMARGGLIFTVAALYLMKAYVTKDWLAFSEVFGMPLRYAQLMGNASEDEKKEIFNALKCLSSDASAIFDPNVRIEFLGVNNTSHGDFYEKAVRFWNQEISKVTLGQTMTSEDGSSLAQAAVHNDVRLDIRDADAKALAQTINAFLVGPIVDFNFGVGTPRPVFSFSVEEPDDLQAFTDAVVPLIDRGFDVPIAYLHERFGIPKPEDGEAVLGVRDAEPDPPASELDETPPGEPLPEEDEPEAMTAMQAARALEMPLTAFLSAADSQGLTVYRNAQGRRRFPARDVEAVAEARARETAEA